MSCTIGGETRRLGYQSVGQKLTGAAQIAANYKLNSFVVLSVWRRQIGSLRMVIFTERTPADRDGHNFEKCFSERNHKFTEMRHLARYSMSQ
jgi:hypothetical protein